MERKRWGERDGKKEMGRKRWEERDGKKEMGNGYRGLFPGGKAAGE
jgi:hypothetical protein